MKTAVVCTFAAAMHLAAAIPDAVITPAAQLQPRQDAGPSLLGCVHTRGKSEYAPEDRRTCDFPATLTVRGELAQCCEPSAACNFFSECSAGTLFAESTSVFCDQGYCNTGVIIESTAEQTATVGFLGCWPTELGEDLITLMRWKGDPPQGTVVAPTATGEDGAMSTSESDSVETASATETGDESTPATDGESTETSSTTPSSTGGAAPLALGSFGVLGMLAGAVAVLSSSLDG